MRQRSQKRQQLNEEVNPLRDEYRSMFPQCQWCQAMATDLHEISRGPARGSSLAIRAALLHLCRECHKCMDWLPVVAQLAIKRLADPQGYDRRRVNVLRGRAENSVTEQEVDRWVVRLYILGTNQITT